MAKDRAAWRAKKEAEADLREHLRDHRNSFAGLEGNPSPLCLAAIFARLSPVLRWKVAPMGSGTMGVVGPRESSYNPGEKVLPPPEEPEPEPAPDEPTVAPPGFTVPVGGSDDAALRAAQVR